MNEKTRNLLASLIVLGVSAYWFMESGTFRPLSRLFPRVIAAVVFVLALLLIVLTMTGKGPRIRIVQGNPEVRHLRSGTLIGATIVWTVLIPLTGLLSASIVGVVSIGILTFRAHIGTVRAIVIAVVVVVAFYLLFALVLSVPFPRGVLI